MVFGHWLFTYFSADLFLIAGEPATLYAICARAPPHPPKRKPTPLGFYLSFTLSVCVCYIEEIEFLGILGQIWFLCR